MDIYRLIMTIGALILLFAQIFGHDGEWSYEVLMIIGLFAIVIPPLIKIIEIIRYHV